MMTTTSMVSTSKRREGEGCSSDSEDSDNFPGRHSDIETLLERGKSKAAKKKVKRAAALSESRRPSKRRRVDTEPRVKNQNVKKDPPIRLPPEILLKVFLFGVQLEGVTKFLPRVSRVCKEWRDTASDPCLLQHLDLSAKGEGGDSISGISRVITLTRKRLDTLLSTRDLSQCQTISLGRQYRLTVRDIKTALAQTRRLTSLNLRGCRARSELLEALPELCPALERVDLSQPAPTGGALSYTDIERLVRAFAPRLVELRLGGLPVTKHYVVPMLTTVMQTCPLLEELDLSLSPSQCIQGTTISRLMDMPKLARACPRLTELRLNGHVFVDFSGETEPYVPSFTKLKRYSQAYFRLDYNATPAFYRMFEDNDLEELNVSRSCLLPSELKVRSIKNLYLADMKWSASDVGEITRCMLTWHNSIELLDISGNTMDWINEELMYFHLREACASSVLQVINLSNSAVKADTVVSILGNCRALRSIDLTSCRALPRGCKRVFDRENFHDLLARLVD